MSKDTVQDGQVVTMEYTLRVDGEVLDSSDGVGPLQFLAGYDNIVPGLEREMIGMKIGESKDVVVSPADGYGEFDNEAFMEVPRSEFPEDMELEEGIELNVTDEDGKSQYARVEGITAETVNLDFNHPLAGAELHFSVKVTALRDPTEEELDHGHVHEEGHHH
ncbi:MAG: peptidylprolyl isomerase [Anaerolineales bacterium]|uniref:FKBP-type peptidyl-prolyl cis-trans isomerase n=1 Tax=Candidatus Villigracilis saccharophilus TaxID=3140684 RepID=UPI003135D691|nr:peptidylprolyl isomerase [Anaerolineales bacterium]MBK8418463.1 peptidylprolyl isomerase [Anaerolineales bacterium]